MPATPPPYLIADIGATNFRLCLCDGSGAEQHLSLPSTAFASLESGLTAALAAFPMTVQPRLVALAVAGPVTGDQVRLTNLGWQFSIRALTAAFGFERLEVINDFTAVALALPWLRPADWIALGESESESESKAEAAAGAPLAVLGPGSGLGVSGLLPVGGDWVALSGEGGHVTMAAANDRESAVLAVLRRRLGHVSAELVLSGPGLVNLLEALAELDGQAPPRLTAAAITDSALAGRSTLCQEAVALFGALLGTVAGNLALTLGARGGVYIAGGIAPRIAGLLEQSPFRRRFVERGVQTAYLAPVPTRIISHPAPAFLGLRALLGRAQP